MEGSLVGLPAHVALDILRQLDARDLCALRATCRAFDFPLVETAAAEACRALAPWLTAPHPGESWVQLLRFAELSERARLPRLVAGEDVTAVVDRAGHLHAWGPVVDVFGEDTSRSPEPSRDASSPSPSPSPRPPRRVTCAPAGRAFVAAAGVGGAPLAILRNAAGIEAALGGASPSLLGRPPLHPRNPGRPATRARFFSPSATTPRRGCDPQNPPRSRTRASSPSRSVASTSSPRPNGARRTRGAGIAGQLGHGSVRESVALPFTPADRRDRDRRAETPPRTAAETDDEKAAETIVRGVGTRVRPGLDLPRGVPRPPRVCRRLDPPTRTPTTRGGGLRLAASRRSRTDSSRASPPRRTLPPREQTPACYSPGGVTDTGYSASETTSIATNPRASRCDWRLGDGDGDGTGTGTVPPPRGGGSRAP